MVVEVSGLKFYQCRAEAISNLSKKWPVSLPLNIATTISFL